MFEFRKIQFEDKEWISQCLKISDFRGCEYSFANNMAWQRLNNTLICRYNDFYISCSYDNGQPYITFPAGVKLDEEGKGKYIMLFEELKEYFTKQNQRLIVSSVTNENLEWLKDYYKESIKIEYDRNNSDYIYNVSDLTELAGKKYHGKRNHIKRFMENDWSFEPISNENLNDCIEFSANFYNKNDSYDDHSAVVEQYAINLFFLNMDLFGLKGGVLKANGEIVGFTIGEQINSDTFVVHIEKARGDIQGAYPMICNQFVKTCAQGLMYINREEDLGIEGLRKSKLSYRPAFLLDKNIVEFI